MSASYQEFLASKRKLDPLTKLPFNLERKDHKPENRPSGYGAVVK